MKKATRQKVFEKYNGLCAYTGKPLGEDWQVDHVTSKVKHKWETIYRCNSAEEIKEELKKVDDIDNLLPSIRIINHYKRSLDLEGFRKYMMNFHKRLAKLPKKTKVLKTQKRKEYLLKVAELFNITSESPFSGKFYFENL